MFGNLFWSDPIPLKVDFTSCRVRLGDFVTPKSVIGLDFESGDLVQPGCYGTVTRVQFSGGNPVMTVFVQSENIFFGLNNCFSGEKTRNPEAGHAWQWLAKHAEALRYHLLGGKVYGH